MSENYAVVQFLIDETFSEIPTNWVQKNESDDLICWWPNTKNISSLIENRTEPDKNLWSTFDITVIKYCSSLASARKSAADAYYITTDDEKIGRGQRTLKMNKQGDRKKHEGKNYDDSNDESDKENDKNSNGKKKKSTKHLKQSINRPTFNSMPVYNPEKVKKICQSGEKSVVSVCASKNFEAEMLPSSNINECKSNERTIKETLCSNELSSPLTVDLENVPILEIPSVKDIYDTLTRMDKNIDKIIRANITTNFELTSISKRLTKLESCQRKDIEPADNDMAMIISLLPIKTVESIKEFENVITSNELAKSQFKKFILKIGGSTPRISIHRALERTINNACAINCSWKGIRSNFRICDLTFISIICDMICSVHVGLTEAEFDTTSAEWFRFAKQRLGREEKNKKKSITCNTPIYS